MRSVSYRLADLIKARIPLGFVGENEHTVVQFDAKQAFEQYPTATPSLTVKNPSGEKYPAVVVRDGDMVIWTISDSDLIVPGRGEFQLQFKEGDTVMRSYVGETRIERSIMPTGDVPTPVQNWIDAAEDVLEEVEEAIPAGGTTGQVLAKKSDADRDLEWVDQTGGGGGAEIDDTAGEGDTDVVWSADKTWTENEALKEAIAYKTPEMFGAVGDGVTDDSEAVQDAVDAGKAVYFMPNKTYYLASEVTVDHDCHLFGGKDTVIKTVTPSGGSVNRAIHATGTKRFDTTLTGNYTSKGTGDNASNKFTLSNMTGIKVGDILVIKATDQYYALNRQYYWLGATLEVTEVYDGHIYTNIPMPWDITNSQYVTVSVYEAPEVKIENLHFVSDLDDLGTYVSCVKFTYCKNPVLKDCTIREMSMGVYFSYCVNALIDNVNVAESKYSTELSGDSYGIAIQSCTHTVAQRVISTCSVCFDLTGDIPNIDTYISKCDLSGQTGPGGIGMHENSYSIVVEDCILGGLNGNGNVTVNRCRFFRNNRLSGSGYGISYYGRNEPDWSNLLVTNCDFGEMRITLNSTDYQSGIEPMNNIFGSIKIINCTGGKLEINPDTSANILSNVINEMVLDGWKDCYEIYHPEGYATIKNLKIHDCTFGHKYFINDHNSAHGVVLADIENIDYSGEFPLSHKIAVNRDTYGENLLLPENTSIALSSNNASAKFIVTGKNIVSDNASDYAVGSVSGNEGSALVRTQSTGSSTPTIAINSDGEIVYTQKSNTSTFHLYPVGMVYVKENSNISMSAKLVNSGATDPATFRPCIAIVDCETGNVVYRGMGTAGQASAEGTTITHNYGAPANSVAMCYFYCSSAVSNAETTIKEFTARVNPYFAPFVLSSDEEYMAKRLTGDGTILSFGGINNILSSESVFHVQLSADYIDSAQQIPDGSGVSF